MLYERDRYVDAALSSRKEFPVKLITGVKGSGKTKLLELIEARLKQEAEPNCAYIPVRLGLSGTELKTEHDLYNYVATLAVKDAKNYLFLDNIQSIKNWQRVAYTLSLELDCEIYATSANSYLLAGKMGTYASRRFKEIPLRPLSFSEYCNFCEITRLEKDLFFSNAQKAYSFDELFSRFLRFGGMPKMANLDVDQTDLQRFWDAWFRDLIENGVVSQNYRKTHGITQKGLLRDMCGYVAQNVGNLLSSTKLNEAMPEERHAIHTTVTRYLWALEAAHMLYTCRRFEIGGRGALKKLPKYYLVDTGLLQYLNRYSEKPSAGYFENAVYLQLLYDGVRARVCKARKHLVDFVVQKDKHVCFLQVCEDFGDEEVREKKLADLRSFESPYEKMMVARYGTLADEFYTEDGIRIVSASRFFLGS